ncbi:hypothetical protein ACFWPH_33090 [Nocardia sp. NPDC058499]|uniref:hypothetical protein n=1 Tax=Nocardia sp. NPDC058499 TaxID=3346530 RepID=UPI003656BA0D
MTSIIRRHEEPVVRPVIEPLPEEGQDEHDPAEPEGQEHAGAAAEMDSASEPGPRLSKDTDHGQPVPDSAQDADADGSAPLFHIMAALPSSGATTLAAWCGCADEVARDTAWRPPAGHSPYLVLTAPKSPDGVRAARQLAGALSRTVGGGAQVAAIALLEDQPRPTLALRELIAAAERAGIPIHTLAHDSRMRIPDATEQDRLWTPQTADKPAVPPVLEHIYRHVFHHIAEKENSR